MSDHLEIIGPSGAIEFFPLDVARGVTSIGNAPSNDLRLTAGNVAEFAALLDHRQQPYTLLAMDGSAGVRVNGQRLGDHETVVLRPWDGIEVDGYVLILADEATALAAGSAARVATPAPVMPSPDALPPAAPQPVTPSVSPYAPPLAAAGAAAAGAAAAGAAAAATMPPPSLPTAPPLVAPIPPVDLAPQPMAALGAPIAAEHSDLIDLRLTDAVRTIDAGAAATWEVTVTNASTFVGDFEVRVAGYVLDGWVSILPERFTMSVRESRTVVVTLHPEREPTSLAGVHHFVIVVTSRSLHGVSQASRVERASVAAQLIINPYYELSPSPVQPPETVLRYRQRSARLTLPIFNGGNSTVQAVVTGRDDADGCRVEFPQAPPAFATGGPPAPAAAPAPTPAAGAAPALVEGELSTPRARRSTLTYPDTQPVALAPGARVEVPILVSPRQRRLVGGKPSVYRVSVVTTPPQSLIALGVQPIVSQPRVVQHAFVGRWIYLLFALVAAVLAVFIFHPRISDVKFHYAALDGAMRTSEAASAPVIQTAGMAARLRALLPGGAPANSAAAAPDIMVRAGQPVTVSWSTRNGQELILYAGEDTEARTTDANTRAEVRSGSAVLDAELAVAQEEIAQALATNTGSVSKHFTVQVSNWISALPLISGLGTARRSFQIDVAPANAPSIASFTASNTQAVFGTPEALTWQTNLPNAGDQVVIRERVGDAEQVSPPLPAVGTLVVTPQAATRYELVVNSRVWITSTPVPPSVSIAVQMPTPEIRRLSVAPAQIVAGSPITVSYDVQGSDERVLVVDRGIATEEFVLSSAADAIAIPVQTPGAFTLRLQAFRFPPGSTDKGDQAVGRNQQAVAGAAATPTFTPTPTLPPTPTPTLSPTPTPVAPVVDVLALTPNEIVLGDPKEVLLTWQVIGDADQIQISAPDFAVTTADKKGSISVPRDKTRVFVMTVLYKGEPKASKSAELKVLDPTPTPEPTPTGTPPPPTPTSSPTPTAVPNPRIVSFSIEAVPPAAKSIDANGLDVYAVQGGAELTVKWEAADATEAKLFLRTTTGNDQTFANRLAADQLTMLATTNASFELTAYNNPTKVDLANPQPPNALGTTQRTIRIELQAAQQFDPPTNINFTGGLNASDPVTITWSYNPEQTDDILGFRVYRAPVNSNDFVRIADESTLKNLARQFGDKEGPFCDRVYFVVAVYQDLTRPGADKTVETDAGSTSFLTPPCPE